jgi:8-oxo-(d)GTP phosphatase
MANSKPESRMIKAAGAVAWRPGPDGRPEVLLVHRRKYDDWSLPKGKVEPGEPLPVTAVREVLEEGGARLALGRRLGSVRYNVGGRPKRVHYWSAAVASLDEGAIPNDEVDQIAWVGADHAVERVSYRHDHGVLADFARLPAQTTPVILLRHAKAVAKSNWKKSDERRPLDDTGRADAKTLADLLACFGSGARLITSPAARCVETLRPFAQLSGAQLREEPSLYLHNQSSRTDAGDSHAAIAALLAEAVTAGEPTIFCAHRENIPILQAAALAALGLRQPTDAAPGSPLASTVLAAAQATRAKSDPSEPAIPHLPKEWDDPLPTAGFWVLNVTHPAPAARAASPHAPASSPTDAPATSTPATSAIGTPAPDAPAPFAPASPAPGAPAPSAPISRLLPAWTRWFRRRPRASSPGAAADVPGPAASAREADADPRGTVAHRHEFLAAPVMAPDDTAIPPATIPPATSQPPSVPTPRLISADRYDLAEL